jgi:hypothetical protein
MQKKPLDSLAVCVLAALAPANMLHLGWTFWLTMEQIETGWDGGTGIEMLALLLWLLELVCLPVLLLGVFYLIKSFFRQQKKSLLISNIVLFFALVGQIVMTNLFLFF